MERDLRDVLDTGLHIAPYDFTILASTKRTIDDQVGFIEAGKSFTMNSRHLHGCAADIAPIIDGRVVWEPWEVYEDMAEAMFQAAHIRGVLIKWGGHFAKLKSNGSLRVFRDGVHFELPKCTHPDKADVLSAIAKYAHLVT